MKIRYVFINNCYSNGNLTTIMPLLMLSLYSYYTMQRSFRNYYQAYLTCGEQGLYAMKDQPFLKSNSREISRYSKEVDIINWFCMVRLFLAPYIEIVSIFPSSFRQSLNLRARVAVDRKRDWCPRWRGTFTCKSFLLRDSAFAFHRGPRIFKIALAPCSLLNKSCL
jgi:hypothetical protein